MLVESSNTLEGQQLIPQGELLQAAADEIWKPQAQHTPYSARGASNLTQKFNPTMSSAALNANASAALWLGPRAWLGQWDYPQGG